MGAPGYARAQGRARGKARGKARAQARARGNVCVRTYCTVVYSTYARLIHVYRYL